MGRASIGRPPAQGTPPSRAARQQGNPYGKEERCPEEKSPKKGRGEEQERLCKERLSRKDGAAHRRGSPQKREQRRAGKTVQERQCRRDSAGKTAQERRRRKDGARKTVRERRCRKDGAGKTVRERRCSTPGKNGTAHPRNKNHGLPEEPRLHWKTSAQLEKAEPPIPETRTTASPKNHDFSGKTRLSWKKLNRPSRNKNHNFSGKTRLSGKTRSSESE